MEEITFLPEGKKIVPDGKSNILELARVIGITLEAACGGRKICGKCKIIVENEGRDLPAPSEREREVLGRLVDKGYRLACDTVLNGREVVHIPEETRLRRPLILTSDTKYRFHGRLKPAIKNYCLEVPPPNTDAVIADYGRLVQAIRDVYGLRRLLVDSFAMRKLPEVLRSGEKETTVIIWKDREILDLRPGRHKGLFGMAFDIGTTTVVGFLIDMDSGTRLSVKSEMNPQTAYGDDVLTRISACQRGGADMLEKLRTVIIECLNELIAKAADEAGIDPCDILEVTVAGNTAMHHFFLGFDPRYLSMAPYPPVLQHSQDHKARDIGLKISTAGYAHTLPVKAGFVGSDAISCILATGLHRKKASCLLIDLGTNGEIVLGSRGMLSCCSTAAGPAFEGGHIRWGMRARAGAIERVQIDKVTWQTNIKVIDDQAPLGLCGSGIISAVAELIRAGILLEKGGFSEENSCPRLRRTDNGAEFVLVWAGETPLGQDIVLKEKDISELQMAKAAVYAGASILIEAMGGVEIKQILLAGACGNYVDPRDACAIDLFPACDTARIIGVGNAAGHGACLSLFDCDTRARAEQIAAKMQYYELTGMRRFQELFVKGMLFKSAVDHEGDFL